MEKFNENLTNPQGTSILLGSLSTHDILKKDPQTDTQGTIMEAFNPHV